MRVLAITKIFPNQAEPLSAPFNRQQFAALARRCELEVAATIPWFPGAGLIARWSSAGRLARVPRREQIAGVAVTHPRTLFVPRLAHGAWGPLYAASIAPGLVRYRGKVDVVLGSWAYPDGFAAVIAARLLGVPCVVKLHGSDINVMAKLPGPRRQTAWALSRAARVVAVSRALADEVAALGVPRDRIAIVMNGVDPELFHVRDRAAARSELGLPGGPLALCVANLKPEKGVLDLARAWDRVARDLPDARLAIVGGGPLRAELEAALPPSATLVGAQPLPKVATWMAACDVLVLPSHIEGTPNVVLEALASARPVVATRVGGIPDAVPEGRAGLLVPPRDAGELARALRDALARSWDEEAIRAAAPPSWEDSAARLYAVLRAAARPEGTPTAAPP